MPPRAGRSSMAAMQSTHCCCLRWLSLRFSSSTRIADAASVTRNASCAITARIGCGSTCSPIFHTSCWPWRLPGALSKRSCCWCASCACPSCSTRGGSSRVVVLLSVQCQRASASPVAPLALPVHWRYWSMPTMLRPAFGCSSHHGCSLMDRRLTAVCTRRGLRRTRRATHGRTRHCGYATYVRLISRSPCCRPWATVTLLQQHH
mmetsp:Transcript_15219/g.40955  ORF Transcript_15219/g.40955 Transcript_15219/m.40955 type:complete len:205 (+) Transcript_15219:1731-2345(+)